jgi:hypothetical protein
LRLLGATGFAHLTGAWPGRESAKGKTE